jgi:N-hydroxyarylamine O-acetyltransferase
LRVELDQPWLADVGFGDCFQEPIRLAKGVQPDGGRAFRIQRDGVRCVLQRQDPGGEWSDQHHFTLATHNLSDFAGMCRYHQSSPDSHFTRNRVCSRSTPSGRISLTDDHLIVTENGERYETPITGEAAFNDALRQHFGIDLSAN